MHLWVTLVKGQKWKDFSSIPVLVTCFHLHCHLSPLDFCVSSIGFPCALHPHILLLDCCCVGAIALLFRFAACPVAVDFRVDLCCGDASGESHAAFP